MGGRHSGGFSASSSTADEPGGREGTQKGTRVQKIKNKKNKGGDNNRVQRFICTKEKKKGVEEGERNAAAEELGGGESLHSFQGGMRSDSQAAAGAQHVSHRALNYASLSFHQPQHVKNIKNAAAAEVLGSHLSRCRRREKT